ncbi:MAG TPA: DUF2752 domain-containing protein [Candidatus Binatia bacterium]|nr:DUF2752 domain-containing protein [Candidatus Binatia bacterium]
MRYAMTADSNIGARQHVLALGGLVAAALLLACAPDWALAAQYQCVLHRLTGLRCPFCGMTRDFILMWHGALPRHNPGSLFVAVGLYVAYPVALLVAALRGRGWLPVSRRKLVNGLLTAMAALFVCNNLVS